MRSRLNAGDKAPTSTPSVGGDQTKQENAFDEAPVTKEGYVDVGAALDNTSTIESGESACGRANNNERALLYSSDASPELKGEIRTAILYTLIVIALVIVWGSMQFIPQGHHLHPVEQVKAIYHGLYAVSGVESDEPSALLGSLRALDTTVPGKLVFSLVLAAHGVSTPVRKYKFEQGDVQGGIGQLTPESLRQAHDLGADLRARYVEDQKLINGTFVPHHHEVYVRSIASDRSLDTATAIMLGLFAPKDLANWQFGENAFHAKTKTKPKLPKAVRGVGNCDCLSPAPPASPPPSPSVVSEAQQSALLSTITRRHLLKTKPSPPPPYRLPPTPPPEKYEASQLYGFRDDHVTAKCIADCIALSFDGREVSEREIQPVHVDFPLPEDEDWLLRQGKVCSDSLSEHFAVFGKSAWQQAEQEQQAGVMTALKSFVGCTNDPDLRANTCCARDISRADSPRCEVVALPAVPNLLNSVQTEQKRRANLQGSRDPLEADSDARLVQDLQRLNLWIQKTVYEEGPSGNRTAGFLLGEIIRRMEKTMLGEKKERLAVIVAEPDTIAGVLRALEIPSRLLNPFPAEGDVMTFDLWKLPTAPFLSTSNEAGEATYEISVTRNGRLLDDTPSTTVAYADFKEFAMTHAAPMWDEARIMELHRDCVKRLLVDDIIANG